MDRQQQELVDVLVRAKLASSDVAKELKLVRYDLVNTTNITQPERNAAFDKLTHSINTALDTVAKLNHAILIVDPEHDVAHDRERLAALAEEHSHGSEPCDGTPG